MVETMDELVDEVLKSLQRRLVNLEGTVAEMRVELTALQHELEADRDHRPEIIVPEAQPRTPRGATRTPA